MKHPGSATLLAAMAALLALLRVQTAEAEDLRIIAPYAGAITNVYKDSANRLDLTDTKLILGLYGQWINPEAYQWNAFVYQSSNINFSSMWGGHFIFDYYLGPAEGGKYLLGAGVELIRIDMDAGSSIVPLTKFTLTNTVVVPYARAGKYFLFDLEGSRISVLPWAGLQPQWVMGKISFVPPGPPNTVNRTFDDYKLFGVAGLNLKYSLGHFLDVEGKYQATFDGASYYSTVTAIANFFFSRNFGLSYRFKYMEGTSGSNTYHMGGIAFLF
jgi:hypothetical protein